MPNFTGGSEDDIFSGGADNDTIVGQGGNDTLSGSGGQDIIAGGSGADLLDGGDGSDTIYTFDISPHYTRPYYGNSWTPPVLDIGAEVDSVFGGAGQDTILAGYGDNVDGGAEFDILIISFLGAATGVTVDFRPLGSGGSVVVGGGTIQNIEIIDWVEGSNFADTITMGDDLGNFAPVFGLGGNDHIKGGYYTGDIHGGDGDDIIDRGSSPYGFEHFGEAGNDLLIGSYNGETLDGGDGNDELRGNGGFDRLNGGNGDDLIDGGSYGDDIRGGAGNDTIYGGGDADNIDGGAGNDVIHGDFSPLGSGNALSPSSNDEWIFGGTGADIIYGNEGADRIWSGERDGDFGIQGKEDIGSERDQLFGGAGNDTLAIGFGDDADGGDGSDTLSMSLAGAASGVVMSTSGFSTTGVWSVNGGSVQNVETLTNIVGSAFGDSITIASHSFGVNVAGGEGDDVIISSSSTVIADGGAGNDIFVSGAAADIWNGGLGTDTIDYRNVAAGITVNLSTFKGASGDQLLSIETVEGTAFDDSLTGGSVANTLRGNQGNDSLNGLGGDDTLDGGAGADLMSGGTGNDYFFVDSGSDRVVEAFGEGYDVAFTSVGFTLEAGSAVEELRLADAASVTALDLGGNEYNQALVGNDGGNRLGGGGGDDYLQGNGGIDTLDGGTGNDVLRGGTGNDYYLVDSSGDRALESAGEGYDAVFTSVSFTLEAGAELEELRVADPAGARTINLTGNEFRQVLAGNAGANVLKGGGGDDYLEGRGGIDTLNGGTGDDVLIGGTGDDYYVVDSVSDRIIENAGEGFDTLFTSTSLTLSGEVSVEAVRAVETPGVALTLTGNAVGQILAGNDESNRLYGLGGDDYLEGRGGIDTLDGGTGGDTMRGGTGDDYYMIDSSGDRTLENVGEGFDTAFVDASFALEAGMEVEALRAGDASSTARMDLWGNEFGQVLQGTAGVNLLVGYGGDDYLEARGGDDKLDGGAGNDVLIGGTGIDIFAIGETGFTDRVLDFVSGTDRIDLRGIDAVAGSADDDAFTWIGANGFTSVAGQLRSYESGGINYLAGDVDGDGTADFLIDLGSAQVITSDILL